MQEVTNFGILSALTLALNISLVASVDGNTYWGIQSTWRQAIGVLFNVGSSSLVISLLSSAFFLLIINETPDGRAVALVIDYMGVWIRLPGVSFTIGVYWFCGIMCCWIMHTFNLWISIGVCGIFVFIASFTLFGSVTAGIEGLYSVMTNFSTLTISTDSAIEKLLHKFLDASNLRVGNNIVG